MKNGLAFWGLSLIFLFSLFLSGCQDVFTFSPLAGLGRDPSKLPDDQKVNYANNALAGGDPEEMAEAYTLIEEMLQSDPDNGDLHLLAADLALGASGLSDATAELDISSTDPDTLDSLLDDLDADLLSATASHIESAEESGTEVSDSQYVNAGMALVAKEAKDAGGFSKIDWEKPNDSLEKAKEYAEKGGVDLESYVSG